MAEGGVGGSERSRRSGIGGLRSFCCWQPFLISFRLGELSRLQEEQTEGKVTGPRVKPIRNAGNLVSSKAVTPIKGYAKNKQTKENNSENQSVIPVGKERRCMGALAIVPLCA